MFEQLVIQGIKMHMKTTFLLVLLASTLYAQNDMQFNIVMEQKDNAYQIYYESHSFNDRHRIDSNRQTSRQDSFVSWILRELATRPKHKRQLLFHIHGMWGGQKQNFRKAYNLMYQQYVQDPDSDIALIVSLKWPGNEFDYNRNKSRIPLIADTLSQIIYEFAGLFTVAQYFGLNGSSGMDALAHSLGTELYKEIILARASKSTELRLFDNLILAASDLDADVFSKAIYRDNLIRSADETYVYYSERDFTLGVSHKLNRKARLGESGPLNYNADTDKIYFIDASLVRDENNFPDLITGHSYYRASATATRDMLSTMMDLPIEKMDTRMQKQDKAHVFLLNPLNNSRESASRP